MPSREETISIAVSLLNDSLSKYGNSLENAWLGIYETLLWYEPVGEGNSLAHIIDANNLRPSPRGKASKKWIERAINFNRFLTKEMKISPDRVVDNVDRLMRHEKFVGMQRQNSLGIAFIGIIKYLLGKFGNQSLVYESEADATQLFPGQPLYGRTSKPRIDLIVKREDELISISSLKWSVRHDRLNDVTGECETYKEAAKTLGRKIPSIYSTCCINSPLSLHNDP